MSFVQVGDSRVHYSLAGSAEAPVLVYSNSLGTNFTMWDGQSAVLEGQFQVLRYDTRGHGQTSVTRGPYSIEQLGSDVVGLFDALGLEKVNFCGLSQGGMIGMWLGMHAPDRFHRIVLANTGARIGTTEMWNSRIDQVRRGGLSSVSAAMVERWLTPDFRARSPRMVQSVQRMFESTPMEGYVACCEALRDADFRASVSSIRLPTLVLAGSRDPATPPDNGRFLANQIPGARYVELDTAHLSNVEAPERFNGELIDFLTA